MQRNYRQITPTHTTRTSKAGDSANTNVDTIITGFLTALLAVLAVSLVVASELQGGAL